MNLLRWDSETIRVAVCALQRAYGCKQRVSEAAAMYQCWLIGVRCRWEMGIVNFCSTNTVNTNYRNVLEG